MRRFTPKTIIYNSWITSLMHIDLSHAFNTIINIQASINHFRISETTTQPHCLAQLLAQASPLRLGEDSKRRNSSSRGISLKRDPSRLGETLARSKTELVAWVTSRVKRVWASPCPSRLGETGSLGRDYQVSPLFSCNSHTHQSKQQIHAFITNITSHQPHNLEITAKQHRKTEYMSKP